MPARPELPPPRRRFVLEAKIGADDLDALKRALDEIVRRLDEGLPMRCITGGYDSGWHVEVSEDPTMTHDGYVEALNAYVAKERADARPS